MIKAIETRYKGCNFRSRLEARWAVFFDALGVKWEYEPEGFDLGEMGWYLPDFWLPTFSGGMWVEVKPTGGDFTKAIEFCRLKREAVWLAEGTPAVRMWSIAGYFDIIYPDDGSEPFELFSLHTGIPNADKAMDYNKMFWLPGYGEPDMTISFEDQGSLGDLFLNAVVAARSARFEHGQKGDHQ